LLVSQTLLQWNTGNLIQKQGFRQFLDGGQSGIRAHVTDFFLRLIIGIGAVTQNAVVHVAHTTEGLRQQFFLLLVGVKPELVGAFRLYGSQYS
ncbi:MAG: hypothetical protein RL122_1658, partial [Pseudomonadota bacterium]|jgi:hypothetical protein